MSTLIIAEIDSGLLIDHNADIELGNVITIPCVVNSAYFNKNVDDIEKALEAFDSLIDISEDKNLDCHDKEAYSEEVINKYREESK